MSKEELQPVLDVSEFAPTILGFSPGLKLFQRYTLIRILGRGGMGLVWLAQDEALGEEIALKFLPEAVHLDAASSEELKRETRRSRKLAHPNIVKVYDFVSDGIAAAISMEFVDGDTLSGLRAQQANLCFEVPEIEGAIRQLLNALAYAHEEARIVHRDLKPANVMVDTSGRVRVTDFGIASSISENVSRITLKRGTSSGTLVYMSPQQAMGMTPSVHDDIYSLGAMIYELLTGKPPFYRGDILTQLWEVVPPSMAQRRAELEISGEPIAEEWELTVAACLAKDPAHRPQSIAQVIEWLSPKIAPSPAEPASSPPFELTTQEPQPPKSSGKGLLIGLCLAFVILLAGGLGYYFGIAVPAREKAQLEEIALRQAEAKATEAAIKKQKADEAAKVIAAQAKADEEKAALLKAQQDAAARAAAVEKATQQAAALAAEMARKKAEETAAQKAAAHATLEQAKVADAPASSTTLVPPMSKTIPAASPALSAAVPPSATANVSPDEQAMTDSLGVKFVPAGTHGVLFSVWDVRVKDYAAFVNDTGQNWFKPDFAQTDNDPVVKVSWDDANAFCDWLTKKEKAAGKIANDQEYRLPTDAEWSTAVGLKEPSSGTPSDKSDKGPDLYSWGKQSSPPSGAGNYAGEEIQTKGITYSFLIGYNDGYQETSPVGSFSANSYGLYDIGGNVTQWCEDKFDSFSDNRVTRGSSWYDSVMANLLLSHRNAVDPGTRSDTTGFRVVLAVNLHAPSADSPGSAQPTDQSSKANDSLSEIIEPQAVKFLYVDEDASMKPFPKGYHIADNPVQDTDTPDDVILRRPVYFDEKTADAIHFMVRSSQPMTKLLYSGTGFSNFTIQALDSSGNAVASAGPYDYGSVHQTIELPLPKLTNFELVIRDKSPAWLLIENIRIEGLPAANTLPSAALPATE